MPALTSYTFGNICRYGSGGHKVFKMVSRKDPWFRFNAYLLAGAQVFFREQARDTIFCSSRKVLFRDVYISGSCFNLIVQSTVRIITISRAFVVWISGRGSMPHNAAWSPISYGHLPAQLPSLCNEGTCGHWSGGKVLSLQSIPGTEGGRRGAWNYLFSDKIFYILPKQRCDGDGDRLRPRFYVSKICGFILFYSNLNLCFTFTRHMFLCW